MNVHVEKVREIRPEMVRRACGGWLAFSPNGAEVVLGATALTAELAQEKFRLALDRWVEILKEAAH